MGLSRRYWGGVHVGPRTRGQRKQAESLRAAGAAAEMLTEVTSLRGVPTRSRKDGV